MLSWIVFLLFNPSVLGRILSFSFGDDLVRRIDTKTFLFILLLLSLSLHSHTLPPRSFHSLTLPALLSPIPCLPEPYHVIMEYVMFGKLLTFLRDHRTRQNYYNFSSDTAALTSQDLTRFACQVASGCEYIQSRGVSHSNGSSSSLSFCV